MLCQDHRQQLVSSCIEDINLLFYEVGTGRSNGNDFTHEEATGI
jgi:hypothetical protein